MMVDHLMVTCPPRHFGGKRVVELGAGTGLVGLALAAAGTSLRFLVGRSIAA
jgi:tRNA1(Val) A37 N6-methylase TrmN6